MGNNMKRFILSFCTIALLSASTAFAACALPNGEANDGTLSAADMLPQCDAGEADIKVDVAQPIFALSDTPVTQKFSNDKLTAISRDEVTN